MTSSLNITAEQKLLLNLARPFLSEPEQAELLSFATQHPSLDINKVFSLAFDCEVAGFVYKNSKGSGIFPDDLKIKLQGHYQKNGLRGILALKETLDVMKTLGKNDILAIPLKGAFASETIFKDISVYPFGDIDILIKRNDLFKSKDILCSQCQYSSVDSILESDLLESHYHIILNKKFTLEIHWNLVKRYFKIKDGFWWETAQPMTWNNIPVMDLSVENNILYNVFRLFDHCFHPLRFFVLMSGIIEKNKDVIDWEKLVSTARHYKMEKLVLFTLFVCHELLKTPLPESMHLKPKKEYLLFRSLVCSGLLSGVKRKHFRMLIYNLILIDFQTLGRVLAGRLFPTKAELRLRYNLSPSSKLVSFYYFLNPILLLFKSKKKR